ncbi:MAG: Cytochrome bd-I ubiquinol oxidase subunit 2 [Syntrophus sp. SKADARSKE-3]|nr:Cytochrome bd-I ubiquinol oxidase subunit 2 [Syntrophus sp. SKADARSKE-3]
MDFQVIWFALWGILWAVYFMTDGFDLGIGILYPFFGKNDMDKRVMINAIGPVWDGNEVWLVTAGGATFAAFPAAYALMFSYLYSALFIILIALIFRGVAFEFRGKGDSLLWKKGWDISVFLGSLIPALFFGVAFGNIFQGLPMDETGYHGTFLGLLNPYGIQTGLLFVIMFMVHGALWLSIKTEGEVALRAGRLAIIFWVLLLLVAVVFLVHTAFATSLYGNFIRNTSWFIIPCLAVLSLLGMGGAILKKKYGPAFLMSCLFIVTVVMTGIVGLFPNLIPSSIDMHYSLTIFNASSGAYTLRIMTVVALIFVPVVIAYQIFVYRVFRHKVTAEDVAKSSDAY